MTKTEAQALINGLTYHEKLELLELLRRLSPAHNRKVLIYARTLREIENEREEAAQNDNR